MACQVPEWYNCYMDEEREESGSNESDIRRPIQFEAFGTRREAVDREPNLTNLKYTGKTEASINHPERNEDAIAHIAQDGIAMVLDGVGGLSSGDRASRAARSVIVARLKSIPLNADPDIAKRVISDALVEASAKVLNEVPGAGSTAVVAKFVEIRGERRVIIGSVGDSRAYILREGILSQITEDDNSVIGISPEEKRVIDQKLSMIGTQQNLDALNERELGYWNTRNEISQMLGDKDPIPKPHIYQVALRGGDKIILTSDGVHDNLNYGDIEVIVNDPYCMAENLVSYAKHRSIDDRNIRHKPDDISAIVVEVEASPVSAVFRSRNSEQKEFERLTALKEASDREYANLHPGDNLPIIDAIVTSVHKRKVIPRKLLAVAATGLAVAGGVALYAKSDIGKQAQVQQQNQTDQGGDRLENRPQDGQWGQTKTEVTATSVPKATSTLTPPEIIMPPGMDKKIWDTLVVDEKKALAARIRSIRGEQSQDAQARSDQAMQDSVKITQQINRNQQSSASWWSFIPLVGGALVSGLVGWRIWGFYEGLIKRSRGDQLSEAEAKKLEDRDMFTR